MDDNETLKPLLSSVILAGGNSSRMGSHKANIIWRGKSLLEWVIEALIPVSDEILISGNPALLKHEKFRVIEDRYHGIGPMAGVEAALREAANDLVFVVACDTPGIRAGLVTYLKEHHGDHDISLASHQGIAEPMMGLYNRKLHRLYEDAIGSGVHKPWSVIRKVKWQQLDIHPGLDFFHPELFLNMNTPSDLNVT